MHSSNTSLYTCPNCRRPCAVETDGCIWINGYRVKIDKTTGEHMGVCKCGHKFAVLIAPINLAGAAA